MKLLAALLLFVQPVPGTEPAPLTDNQQRDLSCVAAFAIIASEQERGVESALDYPPLAERGATYSGLVGERIMAETGKTKEQVRDDILAAVAAQQAKVKNVADPQEVVDVEMGKCLPLLDKEIPPTPKPTLNQCAVMLQLAYEEVYGREGLSKTAKDLRTLASVLDSRARDKLRAEGYSGNESDIILTTERETMLAESYADESQGKSSELDFEHCFALATPDARTRP